MQQRHRPGACSHRPPLLRIKDIAQAANFSDEFLLDRPFSSEVRKFLLNEPIGVDVSDSALQLLDAEISIAEQSKLFSFSRAAIEAIASWIIVRCIALD